MVLKTPSLILVFFAVAFVCSCKIKGHPIAVTRSFYYWKSAPYSLSGTETKQLTELHASVLYVKFFEVVPDRVYGSIPVSKTNLQIGSQYTYFAQHEAAPGNVFYGIEIIPVIYIQNAVLTHISRSEIDSLASNIIYLTKKYYWKNIHLNDSTIFREMQIDCDWTKTTKDRYFDLLRAIKRQSGKTISCTLRLYPYKYTATMGVPPVDKATLMCYNIVSPLNEDKNSILDADEIKAYLEKSRRYPLHLDVALPVYSWMQVYQNTMFSGLINETKDQLKTVIRPARPLWYEAIKDTVLNDFFLRAGDMLKAEEVSGSTITQTIGLLKEYIPFPDSIRVSFFSLDDKNAKTYSNETLDSFYTGFTR